MRARASKRAPAHIASLVLLWTSAAPGLGGGGLSGQSTLISDDSFELSMSGRVQFRAVTFRDFTREPAEDELDFEFERARLVFDGYAYDPRLRFFVQLDGDNADRTFVNFKDLYIQYEILEGMAVRVGKWTMPNGMQETTSAFRQQMVDRSIANEFFNIDRGVGLGLRATGEGRWSGELAVFNGFDAEDASANRRGDIDDHPAVAARLSIEPWAPFGDGESDLERHPRLGVRLLVSTAYSRIGATGADELRPPTLRLLPSGAPIADVVPGAADGFAVWLLTAATAFKLRGFSLASEYFRRRVSDFGPPAPDAVTANGAHVQAGYVLVPSTLEVAGRWARVWGDEFPGGSGGRSNEVTGALNYFVRGQSLKLSLGVSRLDEAPLTSEDGEFRAGDDGLLVVSQLQLLF